MSNIFAIQCEGVEKDFYLLDKGNFWSLVFNPAKLDKHRALDGISFDIPKGGFLGVLGRNGSGKSTLLRTVGGIYGHTAGIINLSFSHSAIYELGVTGNELLTGKEFATRWVSLQEVFSNINSTLESIRDFSELEEFFEKPIYQYSSGMKARLFFSVATAVPGKIYLIDEALSVGDEHFQAKCWGRVRDLFKAGSSGILATHDWSAVLKLCQNACILEAGKVIEYGSSIEVVRKYIGLSSNFSKESFFKHITIPKLQSYQDTSFESVIAVTRKGEVFFSYSIEAFVQGEGWHHVLHMDKYSLGILEEGEHRIRMTIPSLPLKEGSYILNLFLLQKINNEEKVVDVRSWTSGNPIELIVESSEIQNEGFLPAQWMVS